MERSRMNSSRTIIAKHRGLTILSLRNGLGRAARRGMANVAIQVYPMAAAMNLKRIAKAFMAVLCHAWPLRSPSDGNDRLFWLSSKHDPPRMKIRVA
jgi:hypothetical protein